MKLGDAIESALKAVGVTEERITSLTGQPCGCSERKAKLNLAGEKIIGTATQAARATRNYILRIINRRSNSNV